MRLTRCVASLLAACSLLCALPRSALAEGEATPQAVNASPASPEATPLLSGSAAPFDGVLVPEVVVQRWALKDVELTNCNGQVTARDKAIKTLEDQLSQKIDGGWWSRNGFKIGLITGTVATLSLGWAAIKTVEALK